MPFPLAFLGREELLPPDLPNLNLAQLTLFLHYAIKGPENPSTETILQTFDHVTKETFNQAALLKLLRKVTFTSTSCTLS